MRDLHPRIRLAAAMGLCAHRDYPLAPRSGPARYLQTVLEPTDLEIV